MYITPIYISASLIDRSNQALIHIQTEHKTHDTSTSYFRITAIHQRDSRPENIQPISDVFYENKIMTE